MFKTEYPAYIYTSIHIIDVGEGGDKGLGGRDINRVGREERRQQKGRSLTLREEQLGGENVG